MSHLNQSDAEEFVEKDILFGFTEEEVQAQLSFWRRIFETVFPTAREGDKVEGKPDKISLIFGWYYYLSMIITDFVLCVLYVIERDLLFVELAATIPESEVTEYPMPVTVDYWYNSMRPQWLRWTVLALIAFRSFPFAIDIFRSFGLVILTIPGIIHMLTLVPGLMIGSPLYGLSFLWFPYFLRCWAVYFDSSSLINFLSARKGFTESSLQNVIVVMILRIACVLFTFICLFNFTETSWAGNIELFDCLYFCVVTLSTVGYGDIYGHDIGGQLVSMCMIVCIFVVVPPLVNELLETVAASRANGGRFDDENSKGPKKHIVICGSSLDDVNILDILSYFEFKRTKLPSFKNYFTFVVFLLQKEPSPGLKKLFGTANYSHVKYLIGSATDHHDLKRACVETAEAVFVLSDYYDDGLTKADERNAFRVWTIHDLYPALPIYIYNLKEATTVQFKDYPRSVPGKKSHKRHLPHMHKKKNKEKTEQAEHNQTLAHHEGKPKKFAKVNISNQYLKQAMIGTNCLIRSSIPFVSNLFKLTSPFKGCKEEWMKRYADGTGNELYQAEIPKRFVGQKFPAAVIEYYEKYEVTLFAIKTVIDGTPRVVLNPGAEYVFKEGDGCFCIAQDDSEVQEASEGADKHYSHRHNGIVKEIDKLRKAEQPKINDLVNNPKHHTIHFHNKELYANWEKLTSIQPFPWASHDSNLPLCHLLKETRAFDDLIIADAHDFRHHLVLIADGIKPEGLLPFCAVLRAPYLHKNDIPEILIVSADEPSEDQCDDLLNIPHLYITTNRLTKERDLLSTGIQYAKEVIIFSNPTNWQSGDEPIMVDRSAITLTNKIRSLCGDDVLLTVELVYRSNWKFIPPKPTKDDFDDVAGFNFLFTPAYVCGNIFSPTLIEGLLYQSYLDRPDLAELVSLLLGIKPVENNISEKKMKLDGSYLGELPAKAFMGAETSIGFGSLYCHLATKGIVTLAIRKLPSPENGYGYMYTNPTWKIPVTDEDRLVVLAPYTFDFLIDEAQETTDNLTLNSN